MVRGPNGCRHRYVPKKLRRRRGLQRGGVLPMLAVALSLWAIKKRKRARRRHCETKKKNRDVCFGLGQSV